MINPVGRSRLALRLLPVQAVNNLSSPGKFLCLTAVLLACASTAGASGFTFQPTTTADPAYSINSNTGFGELTVSSVVTAQQSGAALQSVSLTGSTVARAGGVYLLSGNVDSTGQLSASNLALAGTLGSLGAVDSSALLRGNITDFAYVPVDGLHNSPAIVRFLATVTSGNPGAGTGLTNGTAPDLFGDRPGFTGSVSQVPEPASLVLFGTGLAVLVRLRARHVRRQAAVR